MLVKPRKKKTLENCRRFRDSGVRQQKELMRVVVGWLTRFRDERDSLPARKFGPQYLGMQDGALRPKTNSRFGTNN